MASPSHLPARILWCGLAMATPAIAQKVPDIRVSTANSTTGQPVIAASGSSVYVAWEDTRDGLRDIFLNRSLDGGATWLVQDVRVENDPPGQSDSSYPRIAATGSTVYVVWQERRVFRDPGHAAPGFDPDVFFNRSDDAGTTWLGQDVRIDGGVPFTMASDPIPRMVTDGTYVYVVWQDPQGWAAPEVYFNGSADEGATWIGPRKIDNQGSLNSNNSPQIAMDGPNVYVAWLNTNSPASDILFNRSTDAGTSWLGTDTQLNADPPATAISRNARIAAAGQSVYVVWEKFLGSSAIHFNRSTDGGLTWLASDQPIKGAATSTSPFVTASGPAVYVAWESRANGMGDILFNRSLDQGTTWMENAVRLDTGTPAGSSASMNPTLAVSGSDVYAVWADLRNGDADIYFNRSSDGGVSWLAGPVRLDTGSPAGSAPSTQPNLVESQGQVYAVWSDRRAGTDGTYFNIPFGLQPYGAGTKGAGEVAPKLSAVGPATIGSVPRLEVTDAVGAASAVLLVGRDKGSTPLEGTLVRPRTTVPLALQGAEGVPGVGSLVLPLPLPAESQATDKPRERRGTHGRRDRTPFPTVPLLFGIDIYFQVLVLDPAAPAGYATTNGVEMWIG